MRLRIPSFTTLTLTFRNIDASFAPFCSNPPIISREAYTEVYHREVLLLLRMEGEPLRREVLLLLRMMRGGCCAERCLLLLRMMGGMLRREVLLLP